MSTITKNRDTNAPNHAPEPRAAKGRPATGATSAKSKRTKASAAPKERTAARPWIIGGIDYGPAVLAIEDLSEWAFDLARKNVAGWPEGKRRVAKAHRAVLDMFRGRRLRAADE